MPECDYCGESFADEDALLSHMGSAHAGELGTIDQRRVDEHSGAGDGGGGIERGPLILGSVVLFAVAIVVYVIFFVGGSGGSSAPGEPGPLQSAHEHGTMEMVVLGEEVDFSQSRYQVVADRFHFENGNGEIWHTHATGVTLEWAMGTLPGIAVSENSVTYQGTTYNDSDPAYDVQVQVNGESVDPSAYVLEGVGNPNQAGQGDAIRIVVRRTNSTG